MVVRPIKLSRATAYGIPVANERRFLEWIGKAIPDSVQKTYSTDQIAALCKLSGDMIPKLAQLGLLDERRPFRFSGFSKRAPDCEAACGRCSTIRNHSCC
jgi:hypothetical protein